MRARLRRNARAILARLREASGFGLIEMMIALTVLAIGFVSLTGVFVSSQSSIQRASKQDAATVLADRLLEQFRALRWDDIALSNTLVGAADTTYSSGSGSPLPTQPSGMGNITNSNYSDPANSNAQATLCAVSADGPSVPVTCVPSRSIPDSNRGETAPDHRSYRLDTYVTWGCPNPTGGSAQTLGGSTATPTCTAGGTTVTLAPVKIVTIVVRDATALAGAPVYVSATAFDRLGGSVSCSGIPCGGGLPTPPSSITTTGSTTTTSTTTTTTTTTSGSPPSAPTAVALANGGGTGSVYINAANVNAINVDVTLPSSSLASDVVALIVSDGNGAHTQTFTAAATAGTGTVHFTNINLQADSDGSITLSAYASNSYGASSTTSTTVTKDTVAPSAPTSVVLQNGQGSGGAYINIATKSSVNVNVGLGSSSVSTDTVSVSMSDGTHTTSTATVAGTSGAGTALVTGINATSLTDGTSSITITATVSDAAGNGSSSATGTASKDTVAPTLTAIASANKTGGTSKKAEAGDTVTLTFSEALLPASVPGSSNVTITTSSGNNKPVMLTIPSLASAAFQIGTSGAGGYLAKNSNGVNFNSSALSLSNGNTNVTVTLATCTVAATCTSDLLVGGSVTITVGPYSSLTDVAGNPVGSGTVTSTLTFF
jgi:prepilin-type N-terminal cleavage/methylation domain-containing protein